MIDTRALRERLEAATKGPWVARPDPVSPRHVGRVISDEAGTECASPADAALVADMYNSLRTLLDVYEAAVEWEAAYGGAGPNGRLGVAVEQLQRALKEGQGR